MNHEIGKRIRQIRESKNMNPKDLADASGILDTSLSKIERIGTNSVERLKKIAEALNVNISEFFVKVSSVAEPETQMGYVTKDDLAQSNREIIKILKSEINQLRKELSITKDSSYKAKSKPRKKKQ